jgi:hypothetical protein
MKTTFTREPRPVVAKRRRKNLDIEMIERQQKEAETACGHEGQRRNAGDHRENWQ